MEVTLLMIRLMPRGKKLPDQAVATMIRSTATKPDVRKNKILDGLKRNNQVFFLPWLVSPLFFPSVSFSLPQTLKRTVRHTDLKRQFNSSDTQNGTYVGVDNANVSGPSSDDGHRPDTGNTNGHGFCNHSLSLLGTA